MARALLLLVILSAVWAWAPAAAPPCDKMLQRLLPCVPYMTDRALKPGGECCSGVKALRADVKTHQDAVAVCKCIKSVAGNFPGVDYGRASKLPQECGVHLNFTISPSTNCDKIPGAEWLENNML